ncbi:MAG TPA: hypothetical protein VLH09_11310 [Bryobacteraceae bacterium]|nr:hypothetical protein [Bryobacteraceae bacterium]
MVARVAAVLVLCPLLSGAQTSLDQILARLAEEAEAFSRIAPLVLSEETLVQRVSRAPSLLRPREKASQGRSPGLGFQSREIVSEYGFSTFADSPNVLHEIRQVLSVDGKQVRSREPGRLRLSLGSGARDDRVKRRLLKEFEDIGLTSAVVDLGQLLLLFTGRRLADYEFELSGRGALPPERALILEYRQVSGHGAVTVFEGRNARREPIQGEVWVRECDGLPLRIVIFTVRGQAGHRLQNEATVDYRMSPHGALLPEAASHREYLDGRLETESVSRYAPFRRFSSESQIKFEDVKE